MADVNKIYVNKVNVTGKVLDITNIQTFGEGTDYERFSFTVKIKVNDNDIVDVDFKSNKYDYGTREESKKYKGHVKLCDELKLASEVGEEQADTISVLGKVINNQFYSKGKLFSGVKVEANFATRNPKVNKPEATFDVVGFIKEIKDVGDDTVVTALVNEYSTKNSIKGSIIDFRLDPDVVEDFKEVYKVGDVVPLGGYVTVKKVKVEIDPKELEELEVRGIGRKKQQIIEENERRRKLREEGVWRTETVVVIDMADDTLDEDRMEDEKVPFLDLDIEDMENKIEDDLAKSKAKDMEKNPNMYSLIEDFDDEVPF